MDKRDIWKLFQETGDPICWLLYRAGDSVTAQPPLHPPEHAQTAQAPDTPTSEA